LNQQEAVVQNKPFMIILWLAMLLLLRAERRAAPTAHGPASAAAVQHA